MKKKLKTVYFVIVLLYVLGCSAACNNNAEVEELKRQVAELKQQNEKSSEG